MDITLISQLNSLNAELIKKFSFEDYETYIKVIKVIDGDTITGIFKYKDEFFKTNFRINNIDTPELKSSEIKQKNKAQDAQKYLFNLIINKTLKAKFNKFDKYGRILLDLYLNDGESVAENLIKGGYGKKYDGGTKN